MVIQEAEHIRLGTVSFEDERMKDEVEEESDGRILFPASHVADGGRVPGRQDRAL